MASHRDSDITIANAICHCEEPQATWQSLETDVRLPRFAHNDKEEPRSVFVVYDTAYLSLRGTIVPKQSRLGLAETSLGFQLVAQAQDSLKVIIEPQR